MPSTTIVAIATPPGQGGLGIVRVSGPEALAIATRLTRAQHFTPRAAQFCSFYTLEDELLDQGIVLYFKAPHSFTGEDVIEFQGHGAPVVLDRLVKEALRCGAQLAQAGEFSLRAFLNDKVDLAQAEAIADLIHAQSASAARMAMRSLQGDFSKRIAVLNEQIIHLRLYVEAALDFPEEEVDFLNDGKVAKLLAAIQKELSEIRTVAAQGVLMQEGLTVVIAGRPNAGKSTLINCLAKRDVAIVTEVPGTTRDVMRADILMDDIPVHLIDTAGLRDSTDVVEQEGIKRAWDELSRADCVLMMVDCNADEQHEELNLQIKLTLPAEVPIILVYNKIDIIGKSARKEGAALYVSLKKEEGLALLQDEIKAVVGYQPQEGQFLARRRHMEALDQASHLLQRGAALLSSHRAGELLAEDLRLAHTALGEITGEFSSDDLLGVIFSKFCIGK
ncbi:MAG: tRNA uridine-5-carboxymethylaminomethyl(34) synthesis GTPase MnmE [Gammaproteobacteria bacterium]|nr:tRNA uridine-5-carboxymethylaminomethyl(34) synthesis GTPase MnmE [Gammaproteobacteria bacterium]